MRTLGSVLIWLRIAVVFLCAVGIPLIAAPRLAVRVGFEPRHSATSEKGDNNQPPVRVGQRPFDGCVPLWRVAVGCCGMCGGFLAIFKVNNRRLALCLGILLFGGGSLIWLTGHTNCQQEQQAGYFDERIHGILGRIVAVSCTAKGCVNTFTAPPSTEDGFYFDMHPVEPEPMDVKPLEIYDGDSFLVYCGDDITNPHRVRGWATTCYAPRYACADKRRVLLTSQDGTKHCILFPPQEAK